MAVPLIALVAATLFAGMALYITLVEHPARSHLSDAARLAHWQPSYKAALPIQSGLAVLGGALGLAAWFQTQDWLWVAGSVTLLANWPFTLLGIMPTNKRLMGMDPVDADADSSLLLRRWGSLHAVRSVLGGLSAVLFAGGLLRL